MFTRHAGAPKEGFWNCWIERRQQLTVQDGEFKLHSDSEEFYTLQDILFECTWLNNSCCLCASGCAQELGRCTAIAWLSDLDVRQGR